jgi:hypothetical protein
MKTRFFMKGEVRQFHVKASAPNTAPPLSQFPDGSKCIPLWPDGTVKSQGNAFDWRNFNQRA